ncbi:MAG: hypothetical protein HQ562_02510 [Candidatus Marinimicrobia bacterium]|nr:hypothetical protein [Candidatus Neomarinimicrobiota bacterium]
MKNIWFGLVIVLSLFIYTCEELKDEDTTPSTVTTTYPQNEQNPNVVNYVISIIGILGMILIGLYTIRKTSESNRISILHSEIIKCLIDTEKLFITIITLQFYVVNFVIHRSRLDNKNTETGYDIFIKTIDGLVKKYTKLQSRHRILLPKKLYHKINSVSKKMSEINVIIYEGNFNPNSSSNRSDNKDVLSLLEHLEKEYKEFVDESRSFVGTEKIKGVMDVGKDTLDSEYKRSPDNS